MFLRFGDFTNKFYEKLPNLSTIYKLAMHKLNWIKYLIETY